MFGLMFLQEKKFAVISIDFSLLMYWLLDSYVSTYIARLQRIQGNSGEKVSVISFTDYKPETENKDRWEKPKSQRGHLFPIPQFLITITIKFDVNKLIGFSLM